MKKEISILVVDDHRIVRDGIRAILQSLDEMTVVGEASNGREAVDKAIELEPDVVIMDIAMPVMNGVEATRRITSHGKSKVLALSMYDDEQYVHRILKAGATGYLVKGAGAGELIDAIRSVSIGTPYFSPQISRKIMEDYLRDDEVIKPRGDKDGLTNRENEVLQLVAEGNTNNEIAGLINISVKTVETHRAHIMKKLDLHDVAALTRYAIKKGLVALD